MTSSRWASGFHTWSLVAVVLYLLLAGCHVVVVEFHDERDVSAQEQTKPSPVQKAVDKLGEALQRP